MTPEEIGAYQRQRIKVLEERHDRTAATLRGYEGLTARLTRERDEARAERDDAYTQMATVLQECDRWRVAAKVAEGRARRTQAWLDRFQGVAAKDSVRNARQWQLLEEADSHISLTLHRYPQSHPTDLRCDMATWRRNVAAARRGSLAQPAEASGSNPVQSGFDSPASYYACAAQFTHAIGRNTATLLCERPQGHHGGHGIPAWGMREDTPGDTPTRGDE